LVGWSVITHNIIKYAPRRAGQGGMTRVFSEFGGPAG